MDVVAFTKAWKDALRTKRNVLLLASSDYCPYCVAFRPEWDKFVGKAPADVVTLSVDGGVLGRAIDAGAVRLPVSFVGVPWVVAVPQGRCRMAADLDDFLRTAPRWKKRTAAALGAFCRATFTKR